MNTDTPRSPIPYPHFHSFWKMSPLCPETHSPDCTNPSVGHHHLNNDQFDERGLCHSLSVFIPVGEPHVSDISDHDTRAAIDLSKQPQHTLVIATAVVADMIPEEDKGS